MYNEGKARQHIRRLKDILAKPVLLQAHSDKPAQQEDEKEEEKEEAGSPKSTTSNPKKTLGSKVKLQSQTAAVAEERNKKNF